MYNFQRWESFKPPSTTRGGGWVTDICARRLFRTKFNFQQLLFKDFFDAMRILGGVEPRTEYTSPFFYIIIFQRWESLEPPSSTPGKDRHMRSQTFLYEIQFRTTFVWTVFWFDAYFLRRRAPNRIYFPILNIGILALEIEVLPF